MGKSHSGVLGARLTQVQQSEAGGVVVTDFKDDKCHNSATTINFLKVLEGSVLR